MTSQNRGLTPPRSPSSSPLPFMLPLTIPRLGWSMEEGTFGGWLRADGDAIAVGDTVFILEGEKAAHEIEAIDAGKLSIPKDAPQVGDVVKVGQTIAFLLAEGEVAPASVGPIVAVRSANEQTGGEQLSSRSVSHSSTLTPGPSPGGRGEQRTEPQRVAGPAARRLARQYGIDLDAVPTPDPTGRVICEDVERASRTRGRSTLTPSPSPGGRGGQEVSLVASPRARRRAGILGLDWRTVPGTGRDGRVREQDVIRFAESGASFSEPPPPTSGTHQPATKIRKIIAQRMLAGVQETAPVTLFTKFDAAPLVKYRAALKAQNPDSVPSYNDILIQQIAVTLQEFPLLNACWHDGGVWIYSEIHIGIAVDTPAGLVAPVLRDVPKLSLAEIAQQTRQLIEQARGGSLTQPQLVGGTFTMTSLGMFDIDHFTPILNLPQSAILGVGRIVREPVVRGNEIVIGEQLSVSLTVDHRVVDGAPAAKWLQRLGEKLQTLNEPH